MIYLTESRKCPPFLTARHDKQVCHSRAALFGSLRRADALMRFTTFFVILSYSSTLLAAGIPTNTLPTGAKVTSGQAVVTQNNAAMQVNQSTKNAIINWQQFNIGSQATVRFNQPDAASATLNRVLSSDPSQILGSLSANGRLF